MANQPAIAAARGTPARAKVADILNSDRTRERFRQFAPKYVDWEALYKSCVHCVSKAPLLLEADATQLMSVFMDLTRLGLAPNTPEQHCAIIPFRNKGGVRLQVIVMYQGMVELAFRSERIRSIQAAVVTEAEVEKGLFEYELGTDGFVKHRFDPDRDEEKDRFVYAWAVAQMKDGGTSFVVMPWSRVEAIRNSSSGYSYAKQKGEGSHEWETNPWNTALAEMGAKTAVRRLFKFLPKTKEMAQAVTLDEASEREDWGDVVDLDASQWGEPEPKPEPRKEPEKKPEPKAEKTKAKDPARPAKGEAGGDPRPEPPPPADGDLAAPKMTEGDSRIVIESKEELAERAKKAEVAADETQEPEDGEDWGWGGKETEGVL